MIKILPIFILLFIFWFLVPGTNAQDCQTSTTNPNAAGGLISAPFITGFTTKEGVCNQDPSSAFAPYKIPSYDDLKSLYYTQSKAKKDQLSDSPNQGTFTSTFTQNDIILVNGDLPDLKYEGTPKTSIVFVEGNLFISKDIDYGKGDPNSGLVFIVKKDVYIAQSVTRIDAVIISSGIIYTASQNSSACAKNSEPASQLTINGSLISLDPGKPIVFCRNLDVNNEPAELIKHQVKYLVLLRHLLSDTLQRWSEIQ